MEAAAGGFCDCIEPCGGEWGIEDGGEGGGVLVYATGEDVTRVEGHPWCTGDED
jgi:hypothetical protein